MKERKESHERIAQRLHMQAEEQYRAFACSLLPGVHGVLGVRLPILQRMARELAEEDWRAYLNTARDDSFEEIMLQGLTLARARASLEEKGPYIEHFLPKIDNWSVCDSFCAAFRSAREEPQALLALIDRYLSSEKTYEARFAVVMLLNHAMDAGRLEQALLRLLRVRAPGKSAQVAVAWALSVAYRADPAYTLSFMQQHAFSPFIRKTAFQKMIELRSTGPEEKARLRALRG